MSDCRGGALSGDGCMACEKCLVEIEELSKSIERRMRENQGSSASKVSREFAVVPGDTLNKVHAAIGLTNIFSNRFNREFGGELDDKEDRAYAKALGVIERYFDSADSPGCIIVKKVTVCRE